eukprot:gene2017-2706_t
MRYRPGLITGGRAIVHDCGTARAIGYYIEPLICLSLFGKKPLSITLKGITNDSLDPCVDTLRTVTLPLLKHFGVEEGLDLRITKRGAPPLGGGEVHLSCPVARKLSAVSWVDGGLVKRIRGVAYSTRVSPQNANRMVDAARGVLNDLLPDVYIFTDHASGKQAAASPGAVFSAECAANPEHMESAIPEDVGQAAAHQLLSEVAAGGVVDSTHQGLLLFLAAMGPEEVMKVRLGTLSPYAVQTLRHLKSFFGVQFNIETEVDGEGLPSVMLSCVGANVPNIARATG